MKDKSSFIMGLKIRIYFIFTRLLFFLLFVFIIYPNHNFEKKISFKLKNFILNLNVSIKWLRPMTIYCY